MVSCKLMVAPMHMRLEILKKCNFFWLRSIKGVDVTQCEMLHR